MGIKYGKRRNKGKSGKIVWEWIWDIHTRNSYLKETKHMRKMVLYNNHLELTWRCILQSVCVFPVGELQLPMSCLDLRGARQLK